MSSSLTEPPLPVLATRLSTTPVSSSESLMSSLLFFAATYVPSTHKLLNTIPKTVSR